MLSIDGINTLPGPIAVTGHNRHLLVDSSVLGWEKTAKFIKSFVEMRFEET